MQRTDNTGKAKAAKRHMGSSTTLNRRYVRRPTRNMETIKVDMEATGAMASKPEVTETTMPQMDSIEETTFGMNQVEDEMFGPDNISTMSFEKKEKNVEMPKVDSVRVVRPRRKTIDISTSADMQMSKKIQRFNTPASESISMPVMTTETVESGETISSRPIRRFSVETTSDLMDGPMRVPMNVPMAGSVSVQNNVKMVTQINESQDIPPEIHPLQRTVNSRMQTRKNTKRVINKKSARELKDDAIRKAMLVASATENSSTVNKKKKSKTSKLRFGVGRVVLALTCAAVAVFAIVYFVNLNMPDVSLKVAAMQTGINATYPSYVPRDYSIASITSENKKITLKFDNHKTQESFNIVEESSSWDSNALLSNFVKDAYGEGYQTIREQGLTIYMNGSNATWVNGGVVYKIVAEGDTLSNKQIKAIATSL